MIEEIKNNTINDEDFIGLRDLWGLFLPRWKWFLLSMVVAFGTAVLYLLSTPAIYTRSASILVKDDAKGNSATNAMNEFSDLGIFKSNTNINNELLTLQSPTLMAEVIKRLRLDETFTISSGMKEVELYGNAPLVVHWMGKTRPVSFTVNILTGRSLYISDIVIENEESDAVYQVEPGDTLRTEAGTMVVDLSNHYADGFISVPVRYSKMTFDSVTDRYTKDLRVTLGNEDATIINLSIDNASYQKAEDILNTLIEVYNENWVQDKNQIAVSTSQFINERLGVIEGELGNVDENISSYKSENLLPDVQAASNLYLAQSAENKKELLALNNQISSAQFIRQELAKMEADKPLPTNTGIANSSIENQIMEYNNMVLDRNRLKANSSEKNPLVIDLESSLMSLRETIIQSIDNLISSLNIQVNSIRRQEVTTTHKLSSNPNQAKYLLSVERQQKVKEALYLYLLQKREENELSQAFTAYNTRVITAPRGSMLPTSPKRLNILLVAFVLGLMVPASVIFIKESLNNKVRGRKDLEKLNIPFIGEIPLCSDKKRWRKQKTNAVVVSEGKRDIINEAFRVLRSNIDFILAKDKKENVFVLTSYNPGSGKSFISLNLALCFALKRKKVLVIDGDMRHGTLSSHIDSPKKGLSDFLSSQTDNWKDLLVTDEKHETLQYLPVGTVPPNPTELLEEGGLASLLEEARNEYDYIFIDCPPIELVADTQIIEKMADRTIFIVRSGLMERAMLPDLENIYQEKRYKGMTLVLNGTESADGRYGYRYGYKYGYHSGYASYYGSK